MAKLTRSPIARPRKAGVVKDISCPSTSVMTCPSAPMFSTSTTVPVSAPGVPSGHSSIRAGRRPSSTSADLGVTWSAARNITADVARPGDAVITPGNGHATQLSSGRLLMAGYLRPAGDASEHCATIASDDHGKTWRLQPSNGKTGNGTSECEVVEVSDGAGSIVIMDERRNKEEQQHPGGDSHIERLDGAEVGNGHLHQGPGQKIAREASTLIAKQQQRGLLPVVQPVGHPPFANGRHNGCSTVLRQ